jgi:hypothetical protein
VHQPIRPDQIVSDFLWLCLRQVFNYERPHEGLNNATPGSVYLPSSTTLPRNLIEYVYPKGFELRRVNNSGDISWHKGRVFISEVFRFEVLGFEKLVNLTRKRFASGRFRSCDEWMFEVNFRQAGFSATCREHSSTIAWQRFGA